MPIPMHPPAQAAARALEQAAAERAQAAESEREVGKARRALAAEQAGLAQREAELREGLAHLEVCKGLHCQMCPVLDGAENLVFHPL